MGVSLALMATTLSSCDLDTTPTTSLDSDAAFKTTTYACLLYTSDAADD